MAKSLNKAMLLGHLTRDPELRYTAANNSALCSFGIATNRSWVSKDGEKTEDVEFHNITAWGKLAEICGSLLHKGDKVYVEGRLQTRKWEGEDKVERRSTDIVIDDMILTKSVSGFSGAGATGTSKSLKSDDKAVKATSSNDDSDVEDVSDDVPF